MPSQAQFQILKITANSDHPVRNSLGHLVFGSHVLWENGVASDGDKGSLAPNVFSYDFKSPVPASSSICVTVGPLGNGVGAGGEYRLQGTFDNVVVFESDFISVDSTEITITANVVQPQQSQGPFSWSGLFTWGLKHKLTDEISCVSSETYLELYWVSKEVDPIFFSGRSGIPVDLLRNAIPGLKDDGLKSLMDIPPDVIQRATVVAYFNYSKIYDTVHGASHFGVSFSGGNFQYNYYIAAAAGGQPGSLQQTVNCYDQGAMVQVVGTLWSNRPSWLGMAPCGFINTTYLVGVPQPCNNPFFNHVSPPLPPLLPINDRRRMPFGNHVFNGYLSTYNPTTDRIYDACGGPVTNGLSPQAYVNQTVDAATSLNYPPLPGTVAAIRQYGGVTTVSNFQQAVEPSKTVDDLLQVSSASAQVFKSFSQIHWDDLAQWIKSVIGESAKVAFQEVRFADGAVEALWHLVGIDHRNGDGNLVFRVRVHTSVGHDGKLDDNASSAQALNDLRFTLKNNDMNSGSNDPILKSFWEPSPLTDFAQHAIQLKATVPRGRFLIASGNSLIDVTGGPSSSSLEPIVRKVLSHTTVDKPLSHEIPAMTDHRFDIPQDRKGGRDNVVKGIATSFTISSHVSSRIAAASAYVKDGGVLFRDATIVNGDGKSTVKFAFVTRTVGKHDVALSFATSLGLTSSKKTIQVEVIN